MKILIHIMALLAVSSVFTAISLAFDWQGWLAVLLMVTHAVVLGAVYVTGIEQGILVEQKKRDAVVRLFTRSGWKT